MRKKYGVLTKVNSLDLLLLKYKPELFWKGVDTIGERCFAGSSIEEIKIPKTIKEIRDSAFKNCTALKKVDFEIFDGCTSLNDRIRAVKNNGTIEIGDDAFRWCSSLEKISLPVDYLNENVFSSYDINLKELEVFGTLGSRSLRFVKSLEKVFVQGDVEYEACGDCKNLRNAVVLGDTISGDAFSGSGLEEIVFYGKQIDAYAFFSCSNLKDIKFTDNLTTFKGLGFDIRDGDNYHLYTEGNGTFYHLSRDDMFSEKFRYNIGRIPHLIKDFVTPNPFSTTNKEVKHLPICAMLLKDNKVSLFKSFNEDKQDSLSELYSVFEKEDFQCVDRNLDLFGATDDQLKNLLNLIEQSVDREKILAYAKGSLQIPIIIDSLVKHLKSDPNKRFDALKVATEDHKWFVACSKQIKNFNYVDGRTSLPVAIFMHNMGVFDKKVDVAQKASSFCAEIINQVGFENFKKLSSMELKYNPKISKYLFAHKKELIEDLRSAEPLLVPFVNRFNEIQVSCMTKHFKEKQVTFDNVFNFLSAEEQGKESPNLELYKMFLRLYGSKEDVVEITENALFLLDTKERKGVPDHILKSPLYESLLKKQERDIFSKTEQNLEEAEKELIKGLLTLKGTNAKYFAELTSKSDRRNFEDGRNCKACSHMAGAGSGILHQIITNPDVQNIVIRDDYGKAVLKSTIYVNRERGYAVCNNIEVDIDQVPQKDMDLLYKKYMAIVKLFAYRYNKENPEKPLTQITVGKNRNDMEKCLIKDESVKMINPNFLGKYIPCGWKDIIKNKYYKGDSNSGQFVIWTEGKTVDNEEYI